jgi:hypothetical protein
LFGRSERLSVLDLDPVICADIDHHASAVAQPGEEVRSMSPSAAPVMPAQPERLRRVPDDIKIEVQQYRVVALHPGFILHMAARARRPSSNLPVARNGSVS